MKVLSKWKDRDESWKKKSSYDGEDNLVARVPSTTSKAYIEYAVCIARKSTMLQKHGCIIVLKNKIICFGVNTTINSCGFSIHAEQHAINKAKKILTRSDMKQIKLFVVRIGQNSMNNPLKYSKPCPTCTKCINEAGITKVFYSTNHVNEENESMCRIC
jgi:deoxycytidylate deaminase